jgi:hypothetical protein
MSQCLLTRENLGVLRVVPAGAAGKTENTCDFEGDVLTYGGKET